MKTKKYIMTIILFTLCLMVTGCGKKDKDKNSSGDSLVAENQDYFKVDYYKLEKEEGEYIYPIAVIGDYYYFDKTKNYYSEENKEDYEIDTELCAMNIYNHEDIISITKSVGWNVGNSESYSGVVPNEDGSFGVIVHMHTYYPSKDIYTGSGYRYDSPATKESLEAVGLDIEALGLEIGDVEGMTLLEVEELYRQVFPEVTGVEILEESIEYRKYDASGNIVDTVVIANPGEDTFITGTCTLNGKIYMVTYGGFDEKGNSFDRNKITVIDGQSGTFYTCPLNGVNRINQLTATGNGQIVLYGENQKLETAIMLWDEESGDVTTVLTDAEMMASGYMTNLYAERVGSAEGDSIYLAANRDLLKCDLKNGTIERVLDIYDYCLAGEELSGIYNLGNGKLGWIVTTIDFEYAKQIYDFCFDIVTPCDKSEIEPKEQIVLACMRESRELVYAVTNFNINNPDKEIVIKPYYDSKMYMEDEDGSKYEQTLIKFIFDIGTGEGYDLVELSDLGDFKAMNCFENLYPYIEKDEHFSKIDFNQNVLKACEDNDGNLVFLTSHYMLDGYGSKKSVLNGEELTLDKFIEIKKDNPSKDMITEEYQERFLERAYMANEEALIDKNNKTCNFSGGDFAKILELAGDMPNYEDYYELMQVLPSEEKRAYQGDLLFYGSWIQDGGSYEAMTYMLGDDFDINGFPSVKGSPVAVNVDNIVLAINKASKYKEDSFEIVKYLYNMSFGFSYNTAMLGSGFPIDNDLAKEQIDMWLESIENHNSSSGLYGDFWVISDGLTDEQAEGVKTLLDKKMMLCDYYDKEIFMIVREEAGAFFAGDKTADEVCEIIDSRVSIYLNERY